MDRYVMQVGQVAAETNSETVKANALQQQGIALQESAKLGAQITALVGANAGKKVLEGAEAKDLRKLLNAKSALKDFGVKFGKLSAASPATGFIPGTEASELDDIRRATATIISNALNSGRSGTKFTVESIMEALPSSTTLIGAQGESGIKFLGDQLQGSMDTLLGVEEKRKKDVGAFTDIRTPSTFEK